MATKIKISSLPDNLQKLLEEDRKKRGEMTDQERSQELADYINKRKSTGTLPSGTLTNEEKAEYTKRDSDKMRERALAEMTETATANTLSHIKSESAQSSPSMGEVRRGLGETTASENVSAPENVIVPQNYTRNLPISSPAQSFIANRAREQEEEKIGTLAMAIRSGVNDVPSTQKTQFDLPTASAPKTALELEIQRQAGQNGITTTPATDEEIRLAQKYNVSVDDILSLMDFFGMPFKAVVLRLYESQNITKQTAYGLLSVSAEEIRHRISLTGKAKRWMLDGHGQESFGTLEVKMDFNCQNELLTESRRDDDLTYLADLKKQLGIE